MRTMKKDLICYGMNTGQNICKKEVDRYKNGVNIKI